MDTVTIDVNVIAFHGVNNPYDPYKLCDPGAIVIASNPNHRVRQMTSDARLLFNRGAATGSAAKKVKVIFNVLPAGLYNVAGAAVNSDGLNTHGSARNNWSIGAATSNSIEIINNYKDQEFWDVLLLVEEKVTGLIGVIDPGVENEDPP